MMGQQTAVDNSVEQVAQFFHQDVAAFTRCLENLAGQVDHEAPAREGDRIHQQLAQALADSMVACRRFEEVCAGDPNVLHGCRRAFLRSTDPWFLQSWYGHRARTRPSGFPGDYQMLLKLYEGRTPAAGFGAYLDLCLGQLALAKAVVSRMQALRQFLVNELAERAGRQTVRVLDVACGPCQEWVTWPDGQLPVAVELMALDSDPAALDYVAKEVVPRAPKGLRVQPVQLNALRTKSIDANRKRFGTVDIIYSVGLCDYLPDRLLIELLAGWYGSLADGGVMYVAFKDADRYDKTPYQWHLDWYFYQRSVQDVMALYDQAGIPCHELQMERDQSGIIVHLWIRKSAQRMIRVDAADAAQPRPAALQRPVRSESEARSYEEP
ncbi:MAG: hypothetical protein KatS3mg110_3415 [Pirellulaceae bacterium]|nr:MAG: hypothetical protein KatS3mg110_3415 [Pirellulaceae bacterium]